MNNKIFIGLIMLVSFSVNAKVEVYKAPVPLGLTWGMSFDDFQKETNWAIKPIEELPSTCPVIGVTFNNVIDGKIEGNYKIYFYKKFKDLKFTGLYGVVYRYETDDLSLFKVKDNDVIQKLDSQYGEYKKIEGLREGAFIRYDESNLQRSYFSSRDVRNEKPKEQYKKNEDGNYAVTVSYFFYPDIYKKEIAKYINEMKALCNVPVETN
ncbi:hypothetical protein I4902_17825 [Proteus alimentorum]|uniref:Uncharacterized protein n=1 Tax=Proteus alimentorum TaxID=1973495 RepID=A0ABS0IYR6_9GAMM|nr:hypothetical protein [Proteus alimentorum]MBG2877525.1 hypothetical protein [Proteus alimentorum]MBG2881108.1 hypothetical protein [Proteus alimentorum]